jgi:predicted nucleic acid-binding protein
VRTGDLVDTDWIIDHLSGVTAVTTRLTELRPAGLAVSIISLAELYEGIHYSRDPVRSEASLQQFLTGLPVLSITMKRAGSSVASGGDSVSKGGRSVTSTYSLVRFEGLSRDRRSTQRVIRRFQ